MHHSTAAYHRRKAELVEALGGCCNRCGARYQLGIHHPEGRNYEPRRIGSHARMRRYLEEHRRGVPLELVCLTCDPERTGQVARGLKRYAGYGRVPPVNAVLR